MVVRAEAITGGRSPVLTSSAEGIAREHSTRCYGSEGMLYPYDGDGLC